jgi:hypothetical protein
MGSATATIRITDGHQPVKQAGPRHQDDPRHENERLKSRHDRARQQKSKDRTASLPQTRSLHQPSPSAWWTHQHPDRRQQTILN